jgi:hypothetical protein
VGVFFSDFFRGGIVSCFSAETTVGANVGVGGSENRMPPPNASGTRFLNEHAKICKNMEARNLRKFVLIIKVVNPFTRALSPLL